jgi:hypothetical protein
MSSSGEAMGTQTYVRDIASLRIGDAEEGKGANPSVNPGAAAAARRTVASAEQRLLLESARRQRTVDGFCLYDLRSGMATIERSSQGEGRHEVPRR